MTLVKPSTNTLASESFFREELIFLSGYFTSSLDEISSVSGETFSEKTIITYLTSFYTSWEITGSVTYLFPNQDVGFKEKEC